MSESKSVKRYALDARLSSFMTGPYGDGEWVKFSDIAHLLNPAPKPDVAGELPTGIACLNGHDLTHHIECGHCYDTLKADRYRL